jgi:hypothetical protein
MAIRHWICLNFSGQRIEGSLRSGGKHCFIVVGVADASKKQ